MFTEQKKGFDWFSLIVGILFILAGLASFMHPDKTLHFLTILTGIAFILRGVYELWFRQFVNRTLNQGSGWIMFAAILDIILGIIVLVYPGWGSSTSPSCSPSGSSLIPSWKLRQPSSSRNTTVVIPSGWLSWA